MTCNNLQQQPITHHWNIKGAASLLPQDLHVCSLTGCKKQTVGDLSNITKDHENMIKQTKPRSKLCVYSMTTCVFVDAYVLCRL